MDLESGCHQRYAFSSWPSPGLTFLSLRLRRHLLSMLASVGRRMASGPQGLSPQACIAYAFLMTAGMRPRDDDGDCSTRQNDDHDDMDQQQSSCGRHVDGRAAGLGRRAARSAAVARRRRALCRPVAGVLYGALLRDHCRDALVGGAGLSRPRQRDRGGRSGVHDPWPAHRGAEPRGPGGGAREEAQAPGEGPAAPGQVRRARRRHSGALCPAQPAHCAADGQLRRQPSQRDGVDAGIDHPVGLFSVALTIWLLSVIS